ncbi:MAG: hypothetical protein EAZ15_03340 [Sphingobacteriales bacterium]|nr:MAG: hypothetical protein EAZ15_03340 [Sphingobacteriales bacterium]
MLKKISFFIVLSLITLLASGQQNDIELAESLSKNGEYSQAITIYKNLTNTTIDKTWYYADYLNCLLKTKNYNEAEKLVNKTIKANANQNIYFLDLGYVYEQKGDNEKANKIYDKTINNLPADDIAVTDFSSHFYNLQNYNYALKTYLQARKVFKNNGLYALEILNILKITKNNPALISEILTLLSSNNEYLGFAKNSLSQTLETTADFTLLKLELLKAIQKQPDNNSFAQLLAWHYLQQKNFTAALTQTIALDKREKQNGAQVFELGNIFTQNKDYETANLAYQYILQKGESNPYYINALIENLSNKKQLLTEGKFLMPDLLLLEQDYTSILTKYGKNYQTLFAITQLANLQAFYLNKPSQAQVLLENALKLTNIGQKNLGELKLQLANIYLVNNQVWDAALLYSQVEKTFTNEPLGQEAKLRNAKLSFYNGDFKWAKSQLDVLKASTSQFIANDALDLSLLIQNNLTADSTGKALKIYASASLLLLKNDLEGSLLTLDSINLLYPKNELENDISLTKAKIFIQQSKFAEAALQYQSIINQTESMYADDALFLLAQLQEQKLNLPKQALENYQKLLNNYPGSPYITETRERFRALRGDAL